MSESRCVAYAKGGDVQAVDGLRRSPDLPRADWATPHHHGRRAHQHFLVLDGEVGVQKGSRNIYRAEIPAPGE
eukprot:5337797-Pyramimonas_sp.AAC.1